MDLDLESVNLVTAVHLYTLSLEGMGLGERSMACSLESFA